MVDKGGTIVVGVLGQWASGKSTAARALIEHLGGQDKVAFITDRELLAQEAIHHILSLDDSELTVSVEENGSQRIQGKLATIFLGPGEDFKTVDTNIMRFELHDDVYDSVAPGEYSFFDLARLKVGNQIREKCGEGKPLVIEAGFGTNLESKGSNPFSHTILDLFSLLTESGVRPDEVKWIIIEVDYQKRLERNRKRPDTVPEVEFKRFAADGGDLSPAEQTNLEQQGTNIKRVANHHDDIERFETEIVADLMSYSPICNSGESALRLNTKCVLDKTSLNRLKGR